MGIITEAGDRLITEGGTVDIATIADLILEIRTDVSDEDSTRFTDAMILRMMKKAVRRANRILQRNGIQFAKRVIPLTTVSGQDYLDIADSLTGFDVLIGLWRTDTNKKIEFKTEDEWECLTTPSVLSYALLDYGNDKIYFKGTPDGATGLRLWYYPSVDVESMTVASESPWGGRVDDILTEYTQNRLKNVDEMDITVDIQLMTDMENQILQAYAPLAVTMAQGKGWIDI